MSNDSPKEKKKILWRLGKLLAISGGVGVLFFSLVKWVYPELVPPNCSRLENNTYAIFIPERPELDRRVLFSLATQENWSTPQRCVWYGQRISIYHKITNNPYIFIPNNGSQIGFLLKGFTSFDATKESINTIVATVKGADFFEKKSPRFFLERLEINSKRGVEYSKDFKSNSNIRENPKKSFWSEMLEPSIKPGIKRYKDSKSDSNTRKNSQEFLFPEMWEPSVVPALLPPIKPLPQCTKQQRYEKILGKCR